MVSKWKEPYRNPLGVPEGSACARFGNLSVSACSKWRGPELELEPEPEGAPGIIPAARVRCSVARLGGSQSEAFCRRIVTSIWFHLNASAARRNSRAVRASHRHATPSGLGGGLNLPIRGTQVVLILWPRRLRCSVSTVSVMPATSSSMVWATTRYALARAFLMGRTVRQAAAMLTARRAARRASVQSGGGGRGP